MLIIGDDTVDDEYDNDFYHFTTVSTYSLLTRPHELKNNSLLLQKLRQRSEPFRLLSEELQNNFLLKTKIPGYHLTAMLMWTGS